MGRLRIATGRCIEGCEEGDFGYWKGNTYVLYHVDTSPGVGGKPLMFGKSKANGFCKPIYTPIWLIKHALESKHTNAGVSFTICRLAEVFCAATDRVPNSDLVTGHRTINGRLACELPRLYFMVSIHLLNFILQDLRTS
jgi:hypothetical protein